MSATARPSVSYEAAQALARHLRDKPDATSVGAGDLAREFGLPEPFVRDMLESLARPRETTITMRPVISPFKRGFQALRQMFRRVTGDPNRFISVTTLASIGAYLTLDYLIDSGPGDSPFQSQGRNVQVTLGGDESTYFLAFAMATLILHLACYFRHGMVRHPLVGGLITWLISAPTVMVLTWIQMADKTNPRVPLQLIGIAIGMLLLNGIYAALGTIAAVMGGAWRIRLKDRERDTLSRQDLLERMFDIEARLKATEGAEQGGSMRWWDRWSPRFREKTWLYALGAGLGLGLFEVLLLGVNFSGMQGAGPPGPLVVLVRLAMEATMLLLLIAVGFFSGGTLRAVVNSYLFLAAHMPPFLIPVGGYGPQVFQEFLSPIAIAFQLGLGLVVAAVATAGARVEERAALDRKLSQNDPAALLAELVRLQWQLAPQTSDVCVVVVDAARSAEMKSMADPWAVEYSFREYQSFLEKIVHEEGGTVISTAGDGAIAEFPMVDTAFHAARRVQTEIESFNRKVNRLERAFRLRVGLHRGTVTGSINDVEFSAVIDIAAHVQAAAPIGGIALTGDVAEHLSSEPLAQLADPVDGQTVFLALRPTLDG